MRVDCSSWWVSSQVLVTGLVVGLGGCSSGSEPDLGGPEFGAGDSTGETGETGASTGGSYDDGGGTSGGGATSGDEEDESGGSQTDDGEDGEDGGEDDGEDGGDDGGAGEAGYCDAVADWNPGWAAYELEVVGLLDAARAQGGACGALGEFGPAPALRVDPALSCAARLHAADMATRDYFDHVSPEGEEAGARLDRAGYTGSWAETLGAGFPVPAEVVAGWMGSDKHCANILGGDFGDVGVGYAFGPASTYAHYWTLTLGEAQ